MTRVPTSPPIVYPAARAADLQRTPAVVDAVEIEETVVDCRSLPLRFFDSCGAVWRFLFGVASLVVLLAIVANIPLLQLAALGYLIESMGRVVRQGKVSAALVGIEKARVFGGILLGVWLIVLPMRALSGFWQDAWLIDPSSPQTRFLRGLQFALVPLLLMHIATATICGGKLRHFLWPLLAPFLLAIRIIRGNRLSRWILDGTIGRWFPRLSVDIHRAPPMRDWFVPAMIWQQLRGRSLREFYRQCRDKTCEFVASLNLWHYWWFGLKALTGTLVWLAIPTLLLASPSGMRPGPAALVGLAGILVAVPVFFLLPFLQANFAIDGRLNRFFQPRRVYQNFSRSPIAHLVALLATAVLALPLFLLKIEQIPSDLFWMLSVIFVVFTWPAKIITGWAVARGERGVGARGDGPDAFGRFWLRWPVNVLSAAVAFAYALILFFSQYVSWSGSTSLFENHAFLLPSPFWL